jgi:hypothetical protein
MKSFLMSMPTSFGRAIAEASHRGGLGSIPGLAKWDLWWTKWRRGRFSPSTSVSSAIHSTKFSILTITRGRYNRPVSDRRAEWTQFGLHPPLSNANLLIVSLSTIPIHRILPKRCLIIVNNLQTLVTYATTTAGLYVPRNPRDTALMQFHM